MPFENLYKKTANSPYNSSLHSNNHGYPQ